MATPHAAEAARLAGLWHRLSTQHIALGCSCTMGGISVTLEDFERDIADWLLGQAERDGQAGACAFVLAPGPLRHQDRPVRGLLARIEAGEAPDDAADWLLARMGTTIASYAALHGPAAEAPLLGGSAAWRRGYRP